MNNQSESWTLDRTLSGVKRTQGPSPREGRPQPRSRFHTGGPDNINSKYKLLTQLECPTVEKENKKLKERPG